MPSSCALPSKSIGLYIVWPLRECHVRPTIIPACGTNHVWKSSQVRTDTKLKLVAASLCCVVQSSWFNSAIAQKEISVADAPPNTVGVNRPWITNDDYPVTALARKAQGTATVRWTITKEGFVANCRVIKSSGHADLDKATCDALTLRGRYRPQTDANGSPIDVEDQRSIKWTLPQ